MLRITFILLFSCLSSLSNRAWAQYYLEDINKYYVDEILYRKIHDFPELPLYYPFADGKGMHPNLNAIPTFSKKVALVSFYVWDNEMLETRVSPLKQWSGSTWIDDEGNNRLAGDLSRYCVPQMRTTFDSLGTILLTPDDFNEKQRAVYDSFLMKYKRSYRAKINDSISYDICASKDYKFIKTPLLNNDLIAATTLGELATALEVDAVLIIQNDVLFDGRYGILNNIHLYMYGPNPMATDSVPFNKKGYYNGQLYLQIKMELFGRVSQYEEGQITYENYTGYDRMVRLMVNNLYREYRKRSKIAPKTK